MVDYTTSFAQAVSQHPEVERVLWAAWRKQFPSFAYKGAISRTPAIGTHVHPARILHFGNPWTWGEGARFLAQADVLHFQVNSQLLLAAQLAVARLTNRPLVVTLHNLRPHDSAEPSLAHLMALLLKSTATIVVHNEIMRGQLSQRYRAIANRIVVLPHPSYAVMSTSETQSEARAKLGLPPSGQIFLFLGAIRDYKGIPELLSAFENMATGHLLIAGKCWGDENALRRRVSESPRLRNRVSLHLGFVPNELLGSYYMASDVVVFPFTNMEGESGSLKLAQSYGKLIVASSVIPDADGTIRAKASDFPDSLRRGMERALEINKAPQYHLMTWTEHADRMVEIYSRLI